MMCEGVILHSASLLCLFVRCCLGWVPPPHGQGCVITTDLWSGYGLYSCAVKLFVAVQIPCTRRHVHTRTLTRAHRHIYTKAHNNKQGMYPMELKCCSSQGVRKRKLQSRHALFLAGGSTFDMTFALLPWAPASQAGNVPFSAITNCSLWWYVTAAVSFPFPLPAAHPDLHRASASRRAGGAFAASFAASMWVPLKFKIPGIECRVA